MEEIECGECYTNGFCSKHPLPDMSHDQCTYTAKDDGVEVAHTKCGKVLGTFDAEDDHGGVSIKCPKCKIFVYISNNALMFGV